jgi:hypothetical protein
LEEARIIKLLAFEYTLPQYLGNLGTSMVNMNIPLNLHLQVRKIRDIEVRKSDLLPLIVGEKKIPSVPINAYGALLQDSTEQCDYVIFSSWLAALVSGVAKEGAGEGTIEGHVRAAVSKQQPVYLMMLTSI